MAPGLSRDQAIHQLTRQVPIDPTDEASAVGVEKYLPLNGHIFDLAISPDADRVAFTTARQVFPLSPPNLVTLPPAQVGLTELYLIDFETESLQRLTHGIGGGQEASLTPLVPNGQDGGGATSPTLDEDGHVVAFTSIASNLVQGDGNEKSDVFAITDTGAAGPGSVATPPPLGRRKVRRRRRLVLSAFSLPHGGVKLVVIAPSGGKVSASARAPLALGRRPKRLAAAHAPAKAGRPARLILELRPRFRQLAHSREGLYATALVSFQARRGKTLHGRLDIRFHAHSRRRR